MTDSPTRKGDWKSTFSGVKFWPFDPSPDEVNLADIAHQLSLICRWNGCVTEFYSVAQHACMVATLVERIAPNLALAALHHDSAEAYLGDITRPVKHFLEVDLQDDEDTPVSFAEMEHRLRDTIFNALGISILGSDAAVIVKIADDSALKIEADHLMPHLQGQGSFTDNLIPPYWQWQPGWTPQYAESNFLTMHQALKEKQCTPT